jgi:uncharacterized membrane protein YtjA (UPF0391 family)
MFKLSHTEENIMLGWALTFLIIAILAGVMGFGGIAGTAAGIAKIIFEVKAQGYKYTLLTLFYLVYGDSL